MGSEAQTSIHQMPDFLPSFQVGDLGRSKCLITDDEAPIHSPLFCAPEQLRRAAGQLRPDGELDKIIGFDTSSVISVLCMSERMMAGSRHNGKLNGGS